ncbi:MAG: hypothetical protein NVS2B16_32600 [Chloroflexota bacterium]
MQAEKIPTRQIMTSDAAQVIEGLIIEFVRPRLNNRGGDLFHVAKYIQSRSKLVSGDVRLG